MDNSPITVSNTHEQLVLDDEAVIKLALVVCAGERVEIDELSIVLADHQTVRELNKTYLSHDYNTDVLSFSLSDPNHKNLDGEVYIDLDTAHERHQEFNTSFEMEAYRYITHGLLHLMGYEDATVAQKDAMRSKEDLYLDQFAKL